MSQKKYRKLDDQQLLELLKGERKSDAALSELFKRYSLLVMGIALKYFHQKEKAEEITLDLFAELKGKVLKYEIHNFSSWLHTTARNACLMELRKKKKEYAQEDAGMDEVYEDDLDWKQQQEQNFNLLEQALESLKPAQSRCLKLFYFKEKCYEEIAAMTQFSIKEVKSHLQNGKRNLKIKMERDA